VSAETEHGTAEASEMPTYEYACRDCGEHLEIVQSFKDDALTVCPNCQGNLRKVFSPIGIAFKGDGFYKTDSRSSKTAASNGGSGTSESKSDSKSESKSDSKSDSKSESKSDSKSKDSASTSSTKPEAKSA
jgi:putative FmdB family regulatory protein